MTVNRTEDRRVGSIELGAEALDLQPEGKPPAVVHVPAPLEKRPRRKRRWLRRGLLVLALVAAAMAAGYWWLHRPPPLPPGFASGNGRLEADEIDIDTKFAGRIANLLVDEGDLVQPGQVLAVMDTRDLQASLDKAKALVSQAQRSLDEAKANAAQQQSEVKRAEAVKSQAQRALDESKSNLAVQQTQTKLAKQELDRTAGLAPKGYATVELLDQRRQQMNAAIAAENAATARVDQAGHQLEAADHQLRSALAASNAAAAKVGEAEHAIDAASRDVQLYQVNIADNTLVAPREGRIQYRVANVGEVLASGGKVFTMLDTSYVYMDVYLPTSEAGRVRIGSEARIVLDAYPTHIIPAKVVFVASQAQFTPKTVETKNEREKLTFRIRVRIDPERLRGRAEIVRSGLPGVAYVRLDRTATWPEQLKVSPPP
jgi:HlyD family secretion protein